MKENAVKQCSPAKTDTREQEEFYYDEKYEKNDSAWPVQAMMIASMGITGCGKADGQTKEETKTTAVETPARNGDICD